MMSFAKVLHMSNVIDPSIGQRIKAKRLELGIGPGEMSDKLHVTLGMINHLETGKRMPSVESLVVLAKVLRCSTDYLLGLKGGKRQQGSENEPPQDS
jgi:transcriptional regulator with XRE-family HTH domain